MDTHDELCQPPGRLLAHLEVGNCVGIGGEGSEAAGMLPSGGLVSGMVLLLVGATKTKKNVCKKPSLRVWEKPSWWEVCRFVISRIESNACMLTSENAMHERSKKVSKAGLLVDC